MLIDIKHNQAKDEHSGDEYLKSSMPDSYQDSKKYLYLGFFIFCVLLLAFIVGAYFIVNSRRTPKVPIDQTPPVDITPATSTEPQTGGLPPDIFPATSTDQNGLATTSNIKAEDLIFGAFYEPEVDDFNKEITSYQLPINVKTDVTNYHAVARAINLDTYINSLNKYGFAIVPTDKSLVANDFYSSYRALANKGIPSVLTSDFILYFYQNNLKQIYKEIEATTFFENVWDVSNSLYQIALTRYKKKKEQVGLANDPVLEAERLECAYFATALRLLSPTKEQIIQSSTANDNNLFDQTEAQKYYFELPDFIKDDVEKEVAYIKGVQKKAVKSPIFLYDRDYLSFTVPAEYSRSAKLRNYYLTLKWFNSLFPLNYKNADCPNCLLDFDDWKINMIAANLIASDLYSNQDLKNKWAIVYKFIAFFSGLRQDLIYLHYQKELANIYGSERKTEDIFSNIKNDDEYKKLQTDLAALRFIDLEGGISRVKENQPIIGLRLLQESYWPNDYLFGRLAGPTLKPNSDNTRDKKATYCGAYGPQRCTGFSYDIANLVYAKQLSLQNKYYTANIDYKNYDQVLATLKGEINKFNNNSWNSNVFWITLDINRSVANYDQRQFPIYSRDSAWQEKRDVNTILGSWADINLPLENIYDYYEKKGSNLGDYPECSNLSYIEPNIKLVNEIIAKNKMLIKMLNALNMTSKNNIASVELINLNNKFIKLVEITKHELNNEELNSEECNFINDFAVRSAVDRGNRSFVITTNKKELSESIDGIKYAAIVYQQAGKLILGLGPIFNFNEYAGK
jgi:hypothetical protein